MKATEREKFHEIKNRLLILYEILEMSRDTLLFSEVINPDQVGIVLDGVAKEAAKLICEMGKMIQNAERKRIQSAANTLDSIKGNT